MKVAANRKFVRKGGVSISQPPSKQPRGALFKEISSTMPIDSTRYVRVVRDAEDEMKDFQKLEKDNLRNSRGMIRKFLPNKKAARLDRLMKTTYEKY